MEIDNDNIVIHLPLTTPTGKARVKRRKAKVGIPISTKNKKLSEKDYIEWQISYYFKFDKIWEKFRNKSEKKRKKVLENLFHEYKHSSFVEEIKNLNLDKKFKKSEFISLIKNFFKEHDEKVKEEFIYYELIDIIKFAYNKSIISKQDIKELINFNSGELSIETDYEIEICKKRDNEIHKFNLYDEKHPLFILNIDNKSFIEINLKHKQYAVGYQPMLYFCYYLKYAKDDNDQSILGRCARTKEKVKIFLSKEHLINITKAFILMSEEYSSDIKEALNEL